MLIKAFSHIIQSFLMVAVGYSIIGIKLDRRKIIGVTILNSICIMGVRSLYNKFNIPYGTHTIVLAIIYTLICKLITKENLINSLISTLISFSLIVVQELIVLLPIVYIFKVDIDKLISNNNFMFILITFIGNSLLGILYIFFFKLDHSIINLGEYKK
ncbi:hypothetical protein ACOAKC_01410 [Hathewaya histolytica]|uniref:hypothetical protein n=1 Tax=Hathewaya histolytica TaxID=1498 RepID=UPI003B67FDD7